MSLDECLRRLRDNGPLTVDGAYGSRYSVDTVAKIDANLKSMRPDSPDVDLLLNARALIAAEPLRGRT